MQVVPVKTMDDDQHTHGEDGAAHAHREGSGQVTLRGLTNQCKAVFKVSYGGNIAIPTGGTVEAITAALSINGEALASATATVTPAAVENYFNIYVSAQVCVPKGCCVTVGMRNTSTQAVNFANSNLTVERVADGDLKKFHLHPSRAIHFAEHG